ncbi:MAG: oligopeptidase B, partial [Ginsengibacter sp.]
MKSGLVALLIILSQSIYCQTAKWPETKKQSRLFNEHGGTRNDDYFWLSDPKDSNVINHLKAENAYVKEYMQHTEALQKKLYDELVARIPGKDESLPVKKNGYWYYARFEEGQQYSIRERRKNTMSATPEVVLNVPELAKGYQIYLVRGSAVSPNNAMIAFAQDTSGDRRCQLFIKDIAGNKLIGDPIPNTSGSYAWTSDNKTLYYVLNDHTVRSYKVMRHVVGADAGGDVEIYSEPDSTYAVELSKSKNEKVIFIRSRSTNTSEERYLKADDNKAKPILIQPRQSGLEYYTDYNEGDIFHIYTNKSATDFKLVAAPLNKPSVDNW